MQTPVVNIKSLPVVAVLRGAAAELVTHRELRGQYCSTAEKKKNTKQGDAYYKKREGGYQTNRSIKTWATYFLLKSLTSSGIIQEWTKQKSHILQYCKITEGAFRLRLAELSALKLITITKNRSIQLTSFETAAEILGIEYKGTIKIEYNDKTEGSQIFQYLLRADEIRCNQQSQMDALNYHADKNPLLKEVLHNLMLQHGAAPEMLLDKKYFQQQLLQLQMHYFKKGSDIWTSIMQLRGDINRSVQGIQRNHNYKSAQSVSYMKKRMKALKIIAVEKVAVESECRTRLYVTDRSGKKIDTSVYCRKTKRTVMNLCDQITTKISIQDATEKKQRKLQTA